jgi:hypothetical protein
MGDKNDMMYYLHNGQSAKRPPGRPQIPLAPGSTYKPLFCGKCLLKLRGWKVNGNDPAIAAILPHDSSTIPVTPCNPRMEFEGFYIKNGGYKSMVKGVETNVLLTKGARDPVDPNIELGPYSFLHRHKLSWESSDGNLASLAIYKVRELVSYNQPTQNAPFNNCADPDQLFAQGSDDGSNGSGTDDHSIRWPALICQPGATGTITATQKYQYKKDSDAQWTDMPEACFILEKKVYMHASGQQCIMFKKTNGPGNPNHFEFKICYKVFPAPAANPIIIPNPISVASSTRIASDGRRFVTNHIGSPIWLNGTHEAKYCSKRLYLDAINFDESPITLAELESLGYLAPEPWP